ncbi:MAG: response regulator, partial [Lachnospiraceae bacterium]|nr:response regulator [Lachnospiraceae bacterium]
MLIFALDDEPLLLRKLKRTLEEVLPDAKIRDFTRASVALKAMEEEKLSPDIIFLDIDMPGMTGMTLAETIANMNPKCHIIFCIFPSVIVMIIGFLSPSFTRRVERSIHSRSSFLLILTFV